MNKKEIVVLSLFDGMSCGQQALERGGFRVKRYLASEIDKYAIQITQKNYPKTEQLGSVVDIDTSILPKIDLLLGGSPCQSFSFAGKRKGMSTKDEVEILTLEHYLELKSQGFEFEGESYLFWEYMRILKAVKPKYFILENVIMGKKWELVLSKAIGYAPIMINSSLLSAQNRKRLYWTNIGAQPSGLFGYSECKIQQPKDKGILLKNVLDKEVGDKYHLKEHVVKSLLEWQARNKKKGNGFKVEFRGIDEKSAIVTTSASKSSSTYVVCVASRGRNPKNPKSRKSGEQTEQMLEPRFDGKTNCLTSVQKDNYVAFISDFFNSKSNCLTPDAYLTTGKRKRDVNGKSILTSMHERRVRRLTPLECERLQTVKDGYTSGVSETQRYKMLGNGWTVDVIVYILSYMKL